MKRKAFLTVARWEFCQSLLRCWKIYLAVALAAALLSVRFADVMDKVAVISEKTIRFSVCECLFYLFRGVSEAAGSDEYFELPLNYLSMNFFLAILIANFAVSDEAGYARTLLIQSKSRLCWWAGRCVWNVAVVLMYYAAIFAGSTAACLLSGKCDGFFRIHEETMQFILQGSGRIETVSPADAFLLFAAAVAMAVAVSFFQMLLALIVKPAVSLMVIVVLYGLSAYVLSAALPGNYMMLLRSSLVVQGGVSPYRGLWISAAAMAVCFLAGLLYLRKRDVLD